MKILLTGGVGYIGSHTAVALAQAGHEVTLFDNLSNSRPEVVDHIEKIVGYRIPLIEGDVRDTEMLSIALRDQGTDAVIHLAGLKAVGDSVREPIEYFSNNVQGAISLLKAMHLNAIKRIVFSSSATVYGTPQYLPYDEEHPTQAINPYGRTKLHVEEMLQDLALSDSGWQIAILRYFNPVGAHDSGLIGEQPNGVPNNLMPYLAQVASGRLRELTVFGDDYPTRDGTGERDYIHVMDLAEGHLAALNFLAQKQGWHAFNLGTGHATTVMELVRQFEHASNRHIPLSISGRRAGDLPAYYAKATKAKQVLGWEAKRGIEDMCSSAWRWERGLHDH